VYGLVVEARVMFGVFRISGTTETPETDSSEVAMVELCR